MDFVVETSLLDLDARCTDGQCENVVVAGTSRVVFSCEVEFRDLETRNVAEKCQDKFNLIYVTMTFTLYDSKSLNSDKFNRAISQVLHYAFAVTASDSLSGSSETRFIGSCTSALVDNHCLSSGGT